MSHLLSRAGLGIFVGAISMWAATGSVQAGDSKAAFWQQPRSGANMFNGVPTQQWFDDAADVGISWARLVFDKWDSAERDFLMGDADHYTGLVAEDLDTLRQALDWADAAGVKVVVTPLGLPGARWRQNNGNKFDGRLWADKAYWEQSKAFWGDLSRALKDHPAVVGYNILNEPAPERGRGVVENATVGDVERFGDWYSQHRGTAADLYQFYTEVIGAIRENDAETPIMVDSGWYGQPGAFSYWPGPLADDNVLYSIHMYEPYDFTAGSNYRKKKGLTYPGQVPFGGADVDWDRDVIQAHVSPFFAWAEREGIATADLVAGEFGCMRRNKGCQAYLADVIDTFDEHAIHWAFYSFREDEWDGYDLEAGSGKLPWKYWQAKDAGENPDTPRADNPLFDVVKSRLK